MPQFVEFRPTCSHWVSAVNLVLAIGLSLDPLAHMAHRFQRSASGAARGSEEAEKVQPAEVRVEHGLWDLGSSVFNAGASTFCAVLPLAFAQSTVFTTFFAMMTSIVVLGIAHGLVLLPVSYVLCVRGKRRLCKRGGAVSPCHQGDPSGAHAKAAATASAHRNPFADTSAPISV